MTIAISRYTIGDVAEVRTGPFGSSLHQSDYVQVGTPIVTVEHLGEFGLIHENLPLVGSEDLKRLESYKCLEGDILFSRVGSVDRNSLVKSFEEGWLFSGRLLRLRVNRQVADPGYLSQLFQTRPFKDKVRSVAVGQTMPSLNTKLLASIPIVLPDLETQRSLAAILIDIDNLQVNLQRRITKARHVVQGLMQDLLRGRRRLPSFSSDWSTRPLGDVIKAERGRMMSRAQAGNGSIPIIAGGKSPSGFTDIPNRTGPTITVSASGSAGYISYHPGPIFASDCSTISESADFDLDFIYYSMLLRQDEFYKAQTGGAQPHVHPKDFYPIPINVPSDLEEQKAIGRVIRNADNLSVFLERQLESMKMLKLGVMQSLLFQDEHQKSGVS
jgi:type I restriction enzyme S subunit